MVRPVAPGFAAFIEACLDGDLRDHEGGPYDVRAVLAAMSPGAKDAFAYDQVPWSRFSRGTEILVRLERLRTADEVEVARAALRGLRGELANSARSALALTVPFLLRIGGDPRASFRADVLTLASEIARQTTGPGLCTRADLLRVGEDDDKWIFEPGGYPGHWSIQAAREAIAADVDLVTPLLPDGAPQVRCAAAYTLAASSGHGHDVLRVLRARLDVEEDPTVRGGLVLAVAQVAREHGDVGGAEWTRTLWSDPGAPPEIRVSAALGWLCLTDAAVPGELRAALDECATEETGRTMAPLPWMRAVDHRGDEGMHRCVRGLLSSDPQTHRSDPQGN